MWEVKRIGSRGDENETGKGGDVLSREKQNAETGHLALWCFRMNKADGKKAK